MNTAVPGKNGDAGTLAVQDAIFATALDLVDSYHREMWNIGVLDVAKFAFQFFLGRIDE